MGTGLCRITINLVAPAEIILFYMFVLFIIFVVEHTNRDILEKIKKWYKCGSTASLLQRYKCAIFTEIRKSKIF